MSGQSRTVALAILDEHEWTWAKRDRDGDGVLLGCSGCDWTHKPSGATGLGWRPHHEHLAELLVPEEIDDTPCGEETHSWDYFRGQATAVDPYYMRCHRVGRHDEHENSETGATWRTKAAENA